MIQSTTSLPRPMPFIPPKSQMAKCIGFDERDQRQNLTLESRWIEAENTTAVFVINDSSGLLKPGQWLDNQNSMWKDGDRKHGIVRDWDESFSKQVGRRYARITLTVTGESSASILFVSRVYADREKTAMRYSVSGTIVLAGHCTLFYNGAVRSTRNSPPLRPTY